jgi:hypothetical protein
MLDRGSAKTGLSSQLLAGSATAFRPGSNPCCHSRRPKAAIDLTPNADIGLVG